MRRALTLGLVAFLFVGVRLSAQADMSGEWMVSFATPQGPREFVMYVAQEGQRLSGRFSTEFGEFPLKGTVNGSDFTINWSMPDGNTSLDITFTGKFEGDSLSGTAKLGARGSGPLSGTRTGQ
jgi:hypothetical protein